LGLRQATIFGGVSARPQLDALRRGVDLIVATPGRLLDLHSQGFVKLEQVQFLVLDEADQLFDMGFIRDVRKIIRALPRNRQTMLFSATLPNQVRDLARECLTAPVSISASPATVTPDKIEQQVHFLRADEKVSALIEFLQEHVGQRTLVFCRTKHGADKIVRKLHAARIEAVAIHGNKSQNARQAALRTFNSSEPTILVATDVAARGLHLPDVKIVINYELSDTPETYVHRIGRTARAEATGRAVTFCAPDERSLLQRIEYLTKVRLRVLSHSHGSAATAEAHGKHDESRASRHDNFHFHGKRKSARSRSRRARVRTPVRHSSDRAGRPSGKKAFSKSRW
jgi:ATP-dependent RNA helicase RhlE